MTTESLDKKSPWMPSEAKIRGHWARVPGFYARKGYESAPDFINCDGCFACGLRNPGEMLDRAHIFPRVKGGGNEQENLHMLCHVCHKDSELLEGEAYWDWFWSRTASDSAISAMVRAGSNVFSALIEPMLLDLKVSVEMQHELRQRIVGNFASFGRSMTRQRQREGIEIARAKGIYKGRKPSLTAEQVAEMCHRVANGEKKLHVAREFGISRETLYQYLRVKSVSTATPQPSLT
jgi:hypothetical protein